LFILIIIFFANKFIFIKCQGNWHLHLGELGADKHWKKSGKKSGKIACRN
jgi:hypothetical protein